MSEFGNLHYDTINITMNKISNKLLKYNVNYHI